MFATSASIHGGGFIIFITNQLKNISDSIQLSLLGQA